MKARAIKDLHYSWYTRATLKEFSNLTRSVNP